MRLPLLATLVGSGSSWTASLALLDTRDAVTAQGASPALALDALRRAALDQVREEATAQGVTLSVEGLTSAEARVRSACSLALYLQQNPSPTLRLLPDPAGFGTDISTFPDLDPHLRLISGQRVVAEAVARRWLTPRGSVPYDETYGEDVRAYLNARVDGPRLRALEAALQAQAVADERVASAQVSLTWSGTPGRLQLRVAARLVTALGPFALTLTIDSLVINLEVLRA